MRNCDVLLLASWSKAELSLEQLIDFKTDNVSVNAHLNLLNFVQHSGYSRTGLSFAGPSFPFTHLHFMVVQKAFTGQNSSIFSLLLNYLLQTVIPWLGSQNGHKKAGVLKITLKPAKMHLNYVVMLKCQIFSSRQYRRDI